MALGAAGAGFRAATGSCGQGIALMQEAIAEAALNETPLVVFNMARNQQDYFQCTRGGGWGDYRTLTLAPKDIPEAVEHTQLALPPRRQVPRPDDPLRRPADRPDAGRGADRAARPAAAARQGLGARRHDAAAPGESRQIWTWAMGKDNNPGPGPDLHWQELAEKFERIAAAEQRWEQGHTEDAETLVVAFGSGAKFTEYVVERTARRGPPDRLLPADHAVAVPGRRARGGDRGLPPGPRLRAERRADDRRRPHVRARTAAPSARSAA